MNGETMAFAQAMRAEADFTMAMADIQRTVDRTRFDSAALLDRILAEIRADVARCRRQGFTWLPDAWWRS